MTTHELRPLLTVNQVAELLGVTRWTVYRFVREGKIRHTKVGERLRFRPEMVDEFISKNESA